MQVRFGAGKMLAQKRRGQFHGQELMALMGGARGVETFLVGPVEAGRHRNEFDLSFAFRDKTAPGQIQANFGAAWMKTLAPIHFSFRREIVPLKTEASLAVAAVQLPPAFTDRFPRLALGKRLAGL